MIFKNKYIKPLTIGELSKLNGQEVRVHFLKDKIKGYENTGDKIWKVRLDTNAVVITNNKGDYRCFDNYKKHMRKSTIGADVLVYRLPQIPHEIEW